MAAAIKETLGRTLKEVDFADAEDLLSTQLPEEYKEFLLANNGGAPSKTYFMTEDESVETDVRFFLPYDDGAEETVMDEIENITLEGVLPKQIFPIATTSCGNRVVLSCRKDDFGVVYFWAWDEQGDDRPSYDFLHEVAEDFTSFVDGLK